MNGGLVYDQNCVMCHLPSAAGDSFKTLPRDPEAAVKALKNLTTLSFIMPDLKLSEAERIALVQWINAHRAAAGPSTVAPPGKN